jgi:replication factor C large subunit
MPWVEKYRPQKLSEVKGQELAVDRIKKFVSSPLTDKKAIILYGPPGTGKTTLAQAAAREINAEIFELNASDLRNREKLDSVLKPAMEQRSLLKSKKIILVDEVDGISVVDRGGLLELLSLIDKTQFPIIITANDIWDKKFNLLRKKAEVIKLKEVEYKVIKDILIGILNKEGLFIENDTLTTISVKAKGDVRAAINDLQTISKVPDYQLTVFDERNKETDIFNALKIIFKGKPINDTLNTFDSVDMNLDEIILWIEENIPAEYSGEELANAYERLSKADIFKGRIYKQQYWRFLVYENILLSYGIAAAKKTAKPGFTSYKRPTRILKIWIANQRDAKKKSITQKYARLVHVGEKRAMNEFPIIKQIIAQSPSIRKELKLSEEEIDFLDNK